MTDLYFLVLDFSKQKFAGKFRRDGRTPYFDHVKDVVERVEHVFSAMNVHEQLSLELALKLGIVALCHDLIEDCGVTAEDLLNLGLTQELVDAILALTKRDGEKYMDAVARAKDNYLARYVKIADNLSNLSDKPTFKQMKKYSQSLAFLLND